jgi:hypothetical protein
MQQQVLSKVEDAELRIYMVWVPKSRALERDVSSATRQYPEPRAQHFWDAPGVMVSGYRQTLQLPEDAWDIFVLYGPGARWEGGPPPVPDYWAHQLGSSASPRVPGPWLDGRVFLERLLGVSGR